MTIDLERALDEEISNEDVLERVEQGTIANSEKECMRGSGRNKAGKHGNGGGEQGQQLRPGATVDQRRVTPLRGSLSRRALALTMPQWFIETFAEPKPPQTRDIL